MEDLCQQHQNDAVDGQDHKACQDPCGCIGQLQEACAGGKQCHHGVQQQVGQLGAACHAAHGGDSADQAGQRDEQDGPGGLVQEGHCAVQGCADILTEGGDHQSQTQQEDQVDKAGLILVALCVLFQAAGHFIQRGGVGLDPLVELGSKVDGPQQEHDPDGVVDGVHHQCVGHVSFADVQRSLHGDHVAGAAHPAAAQSAQCLPCFGAKGPLHDGEGGNEGQRDGDGSGKEAAQHLGTQLDDLADVAAQQHQEDHCIQQVVFQHGVGRLGGLHVPCTQRAENHGNEVQQNDRWCIVEEFRLRVALQPHQQCGNEHQHGDVGETVCDHEPNPLSFCAIFADNCLYNIDNFVYNTTIDFIIWQYFFIERGRFLHENHGSTSRSDLRAAARAF